MPLLDSTIPMCCLPAQLAALLAISAWANGQQANIDVLRIGATGTLAVPGSNQKETTKSLQSFIKDETGLNNEILQQKNWEELADKMAKGQLHVGVFEGYEFAWAQEKFPRLQPLALAINVHTYPIVCVVTRHDNPAKDFAGSQGQSLSLPNTGQDSIRMFVERQSQANGKKLEQFFSKITAPDNVEDALDNVVDGVVQAAAADRAALDAYKRRKPGRFNKLKEVAASQPLPPPIIAYYDKALDEATLDRFRKGLLNAANTDRGQTMLTLYRLTGFVTVPTDFGKVLAETRRAYPP